jgi:hypothetical protein
VKVDYGLDAPGRVRRFAVPVAVAALVAAAVVPALLGVGDLPAGGRPVRQPPVRDASFHAVVSSPALHSLRPAGQ